MSLSIVQMLMGISYPSAGAPSGRHSLKVLHSHFLVANILCYLYLTEKELEAWDNLMWCFGSKSI